VSVCFFWGTTYLGIRMALESFPPLVLVCTRFLISGSVMLAAGWMLGVPFPRGRELTRTAFNGIFALAIGNACLTIAELWVPSGLAALILTTSAFWTVGADAVLPGGERLRLPTICGLIVGCLGAVLLVAPAAGNSGGGGDLLLGLVLLQLSCLAWAYGSIRQRRLDTESHPIINGAVHQLVAGIVCLPFALLVPSDPIVWRTRGVVALLYLVVFGSIVGYSSYVYAMEKLPVALVSIYTYVNPVVAVLLGWFVYREAFGMREAVAMGIIFVGVAIVSRYNRPAGAIELD